MTAGVQRKELRRTVRDVVTGLPIFDDWTQLRSWGHSLDPEALPVVGVITPSERAEGLTGEELRRSTTFVVHFAMTGGDNLEDDLDDYSDMVEAVVYAALRDRDMPLFQIESAEFDIKDAGGKRMGSATLTFSETRFSPEP